MLHPQLCNKSSNTVFSAPRPFPPIVLQMALSKDNKFVAPRAKAEKGGSSQQAPPAVTMRSPDATPQQDLLSVGQLSSFNEGDEDAFNEDGEDWDDSDGEGSEEGDVFDPKSSSKGMQVLGGASDPRGALKREASFANFLVSGGAASKVGKAGKAKPRGMGSKPLLKFSKANLSKNKKKKRFSAMIGMTETGFMPSWERKET